MDAAKHRDIVIVADGTYTGNGNRDIDFRRKTITVRSETGPNNCIIDCGATEAEPHRGFYCYSNKGPNSVVKGFTIINGYSDYGGGIYCDDSSLTIINCIITSNFAERIGGGIYCRDSNSTIINCTISENAAKKGGGFCYITYRRDSNSRFNITNCSVSGNNGGGIYCQGDSNSTITNCTITGNIAKGGGGIACGDSNANITNCTISGNTAEYDGGGIVCWDFSSPKIISCAITDNSAGRGGGGIHCDEESGPNIINCTITRNTARDGGGINCERGHGDGIATITNCIFSGNAANYGGGISCRGTREYGDGTFTITNCTISGNLAERGGGIYCRDDGSTTLTNCILWGNEAPDGPEICLGDDRRGRNSASVSYTDVQDGEDNVYVGPDCTLNWGEGNIDADPCFVEPGYWVDANDPNVIVEPNDPNAFWVEGDYHLLEDSPCIDTGDPNYIPEPNETDIDGQQRVINGRVDIGADEYSPPVPAEADIVPDTLNLASKGKWITCHIWLPEDYNVADIDHNSVFLEGEIEAESLRFDGQVAIARFNRSDVQDILSIGLVELTISGQLTDGNIFEGTDVIRVINKGGGKWAK